jgi:hypothetical protein
MKAEFRGKKYRILRPKRINKDDLGLCDSPTMKRPAIRLRNDQRGVNLLCIAIHEALHACLWDLAEEAVEDISSDIARFLHDLGFREIG